MGLRTKAQRVIASKDETLRQRASVVGALLLLGSSQILRAQAPVPKIYMTGDIQVNTQTAHEQKRPSVAAGNDGRYLVAWNSDAANPGYYDIQAQLFDRNGAKLGSEFQVDQAGVDRIEYTPRAVFGVDKYMLIWTDYDSTVTESEIWARAFDSDGAPLGDAFQVNTYTTGRQRLPAVGMNGAGESVAVWESYGQDGAGWGIVGQRYDSLLQKVGPEFVVNSIVEGDQYRPTVAYADDGTFVVDWDGNYASYGYEVFAQEFDAAGPVGDVIHVSALDPGDQRQGVVAYLATSSWLFAYADGFDISMRRYLDSLVGPEILVNTPAAAFRSTPSLSNSSFANLIGVTWDCLGKDDPNDPSGSGVFARLYGLDSNQRLFERTNQFRVNTQTSGNQGVSEVEIGGHGEIRLVWQGAAGQDGDGHGIFSALGNDPESRPLRVDTHPSGGASNVNGVGEITERILLEGGIRNRLGLILTVTSQLAHDPTTTPQRSLTSSVIDDATADFGAVPADSEVDCFSATGNCYEVTLTGPRPGPHWDEGFVEALSNGTSKTWLVHVGESFADVPTSNLFYAFIENLFHNGVTAGGACGGYCPTDGVKRQQMAVFLLKSRYGKSFVPPPATGAVFDDVPLSNPFAPWIEALYLLGVTGGCLAPPPPALPSFCPDNIVNRQQMAVFLLKMKESSAYTPPAATGIFTDVPLANPFVGWIEELYNRQVTGGCVAVPLQYCPTNPTNRQQMAAFLVKTFGLLLYGP